MTGKEIKEIRLALGLTQTRFAQKIGIQFTTLNKYENDKCQPKCEAILRQLLKMKARMIANQMKGEGK